MKKEWLHESGRPLTKDEFIEKVKIDDEFGNDYGNLGPIYGHQWRKWTVPKISSTTLEGVIDTLIEVGNGVTEEMLKTLATDLIKERDSNKPVDQIQKAIDTLSTNPTSRRILVNAWNVGDLDKMTLPPCHYGFELHTRPLSIDERAHIWFHKNKPNRDVVDHFDEELTLDEQHKRLDKSFIPRRALTLIWNQRSADFPLGVPFNITSYGLLLMMIADEAMMVPDQLIGYFGNCHIYENQIDGVKEQLKRKPKQLPTLHVRDGIFSAGDGDFILEGYDPHPTIKFPLTN